MQNAKCFLFLQILHSAFFILHLFEVFFMDENKSYRREPWEPGKYETGRTNPPKSHNGLIAILLVVVIFLSGLVSFLGVLNVKLFAELKAQPKDEEEPVSFVSDSDETQETPQFSDPTAPTAEAVPATETGNDTFLLNPSPSSVPNIPQEQGLSLQEIYEKSISSVVSISCAGRGSASTGTGVVMTSSGYLVTNAHVVEGAQKITAILSDGRQFPAVLVGADAISDLAVLHIEADNLIPAEFGDSTALRVGDSVVAIGDPLGIELRGTMTNGIVSAINRDLNTGGRTLTLIQTNAALNSGNSGGPLINCYGQVIGINTMKIGAFTDSAGVEGIGFAIPSATVKDIVDQLISQGYVSGRPTLGLEGEALSTFYQHYYRLPAGLYITHVEPGSDAYLQGIENGDLLLSIDNQRITTMEELKALLYDREVGETVEAIIYRAGQQYLVPLILSEQKG